MHEAGRGGLGRWWLLATVALVWFVVLLDDTAVTIAAAPIGRGLQVGASGLEWVVNAYTVAFASCTLSGGALADRWGTRPVLLAGMGVFTIASAAAGLAAGGGGLIAARAVQGAGAALIGPAALAVLLGRFTGRARGIALGVWSAVAAAALAGGPMLGAVLAGGPLGWRTIFLINVPLGGGVLVLARRVLPGATAPSSGRFDLAGALASSAGVFALVYALTGVAERSSPILLLGLLAVAASSIAVFVVVERRAANPLLDPQLLRLPNFVAANLLAMITLAIMCGMFFYLALYLQTAAQASITQAGVALLPLTVVSAGLAPLAGALATRLSPRWLVTAGMAVLVVGLLMLARLDPAADAGRLRLGLLVTGIGIGVAATPTTQAVLDRVPPDRHGMGSAAVNTSRSVGLALGIAIMGTVAAVGGPVDTATAAGRRAFAAGISAGLRLDAVLAAAAMLIALLFLRNTAHLPGPTRAETDDSPADARGGDPARHPATSVISPDR